MPIHSDLILERAGAGQKEYLLPAAVVLAGQAIAYEIKYLGNGNAMTSMGAIEALGAHLGEKIERLCFALEAFGK